MITREVYLQDPCGTLSLPLWKWKGITLPENMKILHSRDCTPEKAQGYREERYFRLYHPLDLGYGETMAGWTLRTAESSDIPTIAGIINASYRDISVTERQLEGLTQTQVYAPDLWIIAQDANGIPAACAIADLDTDAGEGILEWVQVLPAYRRKGVGRLLVTELLYRMRGKAAFATVSGKDPGAEGLYRSCGFRGRDVWHILYKE